MAGAQSIKSADQIGRLGVMYLRSLLAQAGVAHAETSSGEDHLAVDMTLEFIAGGVRVQIKTGTKATNKDGSLTVPVTDAWKAKWSAAQVPVFLVYVRLEKSTPTEWIEHPDRHTVVHARALWARVNSVKGKSVRLPAQNRLTAETFATWAGEFDQPSEWGKAASA
ncbi:DUF4365 domain-containing protein [Mycobacteroides abscessus]|uniref:DUF4365 domain-containing protein n=1 Tax=Mycobacteroides abscessus TaxID=36809 RepID=A0ABD7HN13_9MYCO|nr:DUF4365 domain-containing protein [Mycobacteroides abscessus]AMU20022.1 hypothetical protein A3N95_03695 [Mycobacteroides abscessus]AWG66562.1 DUF4365 domain-containing protein [Mycobacteroides abscessus]MBE5440126.1 hypothetical protein [Mycobacteroides abscessus]MDM2081312.1 DUF4365 domain-containing protein [Mycobacteroides abscessus]MDM2087121.1 DUF4365 domain-containing protein [Mycobacteroides abscessus]